MLRAACSGRKDVELPGRCRQCRCARRLGHSLNGRGVLAFRSGPGNPGGTFNTSAATLACTGTFGFDRVRSLCSMVGPARFDSPRYCRVVVACPSLNACEIYRPHAILDQALFQVLPVLASVNKIGSSAEFVGRAASRRGQAFGFLSARRSRNQGIVRGPYIGLDLVRWPHGSTWSPNGPFQPSSVTTRATSFPRLSSTRKRVFSL